VNDECWLTAFASFGTGRRARARLPFLLVWCLCEPLVVGAGWMWVLMEHLGGLTVQGEF
jgi:hypothetical protein